jgi:hypothetical protein
MRCGRSGADLELREDVAQMRVHRVRRHEEPVDDLAAGKAIDNELSNGQL